MKTKRIITAVMATAFSIEAFTSSLLTSNINVANAVTSSDKASITSEDLYATSAFILDEGYSGIGNAKDLNGDGLIDVFDLVIARQQLAENDVISLTYFKADTYDIHINTEETVTFTVEVESPNPLPEKSLAVYDEDDKLIAYMNDNGEDGDYEANDGIYSAQADISNDICMLKDYYASTDKVKSNTFEISFYRNLTDKEKQTYIDTNNEIFALPYDEAIEYIKNSDDIETYIESVDGNSVMYVFSSGITAIKNKEINYNTPVKCSAPLDLSNYTQDENSSIVIDKSFVDDARKAIGKSKYVALDEEKKEVVVLRPFRNKNDAITNIPGNEDFTFFEYDDFKVAGDLIEEALKKNDYSSAEADVFDNEEVTVQLWKDILSSDKYKVVLIDSHGSKFDAGKWFTYEGCTYNGNKYKVEIKEPINSILTGEIFKEDPEYYDNEELWNDIQAKRIIINGYNLNITGAFIDKYADFEHSGSAAPLEGSLWYLGSCYSAYVDSNSESSLSYNLQRRGAEAVIGFNNPVSLNYCNRVLLDLIVNRMLLNSNTVEDAYSKTKWNQGLNEAMEEEVNDEGDTRTVITKCIISGNKDMKLVCEKGHLYCKVVPDDSKIKLPQNDTYIKIYKKVPKKQRGNDYIKVGLNYYTFVESNSLDFTNGRNFDLMPGKYAIVASETLNLTLEEQGKIYSVVVNDSEPEIITISPNKTIDKVLTVTTDKTLISEEVGGYRPGMS